MPDMDLKPETAQRSLCRACSTPVWMVQTTTGNDLALDIDPNPEGMVEMVQFGGAWRADVLAQVESLFEVGERVRWRAHRGHCPRRRRGVTVPAQRAR
jgi:hypothetical protein